MTLDDRGQSLASGRPGHALLQIVQARSGLLDWEVANRTVAALVSGPIDGDPARCGLFRGAPAVAFVLHTAQRPRYATALSRLDEHVDHIVRTRLNAAHKRIDVGQLPALHEFDLISGLTGLGAYLLHRHGNTPLLSDVVGYLVRLTEPLTIDGIEVPGWWTSHGPADRPAAQWPGGHGNNGMAHGIAGPLALLAAASLRGVSVTGHHAAIIRIGDWLDQWRQGHGERIWWPGLMSLGELRHRRTVETAPKRPSWCYGTPGIVRAQQLAAIAVGDLDRKRRAEQAMLATLHDKDQLALLTDPSLCHGWSGLLQCAERIAADAVDDLDEYQRMSRQLQMHLRRQLGGVNGVPDPARDGLLEGAVGTEIAQTPGQTTWNACLLLST
jgi:hypothetical protein